MTEKIIASVSESFKTWMIVLMAALATGWFVVIIILTTLVSSQTAMDTEMKAIQSNVAVMQQTINEQQETDRKRRNADIREVHIKEISKFVNSDTFKKLISLLEKDAKK